MDSIQRRARTAGILYFVMGITAPIGLLLVPGRLIVRGDAVATADRIRASEWLFRIGIASEVFHQVIAVFLVVALYRLFKDVNQTHAALTVILGALVSVPIVFISALAEIGALILIGRPAYMTSAFDHAQLDALAYLLIRLRGQGINLASIFWGLWLFPFGMLVIRSGFLPRLLGILMIIAGLGYLASAFATLVAPQVSNAVDAVATITMLCELPIIFWLLIWGVWGRPARAATAS